MVSSKRILICPLNWGLGHATRCIPIIRFLVEKANVIIAADGRPLELLKQEFPDLEFIQFKGYDIRYAQKGSMVLKMLFSIPKIIFGIYSEHKRLKQLIKEYKIDVVISDNRFGLWNKNIRSVFISHQLMIKTPFGERLLHSINLLFIKRFDVCWIPDIESESNLSGDLSHKYPLPSNAKFIGLLSRFQFHDSEQSSLGINNLQYDVLAIISGPEPQRSVFEKIILQQLTGTSFQSIVICGKTELKQTKQIANNLEIVNHLNAVEMQKAILNSNIIIARSGYSTIMDLAALGKNAIFIPTPGQTEQEYLAELLKQKKIAVYQNQSSFVLKEAITLSKLYSGFNKMSSSTELEKQIEFITQ